MDEISRIIIPVKNKVRSLCWQGDDLVDPVGGWVRYKLDGTIDASKVFYAFRFDRAVISNNGNYSVIYEELGTKGLILKNDNLIREINRSYYCAGAYEYPVVLFNLPDGTDVVAHCPDNYNVIEIEEVATGKRLTSRKGPSMDFFHSRLQVSPDGKYLMSAGWIWHPFDTIQLFDLERVLDDPQTLDKTWECDLMAEGVEEIHTATFNGSDLIVFGGDSEETNPRLVVFSIHDRKALSSSPLESPAGTLMALGDLAISFYEHPKLLDLVTGKVLRRWPELQSGLQNSSIIHHHDPPPPIALDPLNRRFAIANSEAITVIQLG